MEAIPVMGCYADVIGVRSFAGLHSKEQDYGEAILNQFIQYSGKPVISLESAIRHPLQSYADLITIEEYKTVEKPKIVLTWAPHPKALPQAVPNSFAEWVLAAGYPLTITHPKGYELQEDFTKEAEIVYSQEKPSWCRFHLCQKLVCLQGSVLRQGVACRRSWMVDQEKWT